MTWQELQIDFLSIKKHFKAVAFKHVVTLINGIFFGVVTLLLFFKEFHEALFLSLVVVVNILVGIIQDMRAKVSLEKLQILMTPRIFRVTEEGVVEAITLEEIEPGNHIKLSLGEQVPADGVLNISEGLEVNEALITGESKNIQKPKGTQLLAGSIVTAGNGILIVGELPAKSFVVKMTEKIKQYSYVLSPIQQTLTNFIRYMTYLLIGVITYIVFQGINRDVVMVRTIKGIAALTSTLVPQGLILATTVFFAYGALRMFKRQVLLQEINAIEKLGLIKNLCLDKTGTLTENQPEVEQVIYYDGYTRAQIDNWLAGYLQRNARTSQTAVALENYAPKTFQGSILSGIAFSSARKYGAVVMEQGGEKSVIVLGAPDVMLCRISNDRASEWVKVNMNTLSQQAKRIVLLARSISEGEELAQLDLEPLALIVLDNPLRPGTREIIEFFQNRKVSVRVISGDHPLTVQAVATQAGVKHTDMIVTGDEMAKWDDEAFAERAPAYHVFARVYPEQKEKIITQLRLSGFTAMVGDGANDCLAIKKADLGIAMFNGAPAARQIAQVVLMNNSFAALPVGVKIAETIITNIELVASVFFYKVVTGFVLFAILAAQGFLYPLSPRNDTIINYSTVWISIIYWSIFPARKIGLFKNTSFFKKIFPFSLAYGVLTALAAVIVFLLSPESLQHSGSNVYVVMSLMLFGIWFLYLSPQAYGIAVTKKQQITLSVFGLFILGFVVWVFLNPAVAKFFDMRIPTWTNSIITFTVVFLFGFLQYNLTLLWNNKTPVSTSNKERQFEE